MAEIALAKQGAVQKRWLLGKREGELTGNIVTIMILTLFGLTNLFPFFWMLSSASGRIAVMSIQ